MSSSLQKRIHTLVLTALTCDVEELSVAPARPSVAPLPDGASLMTLADAIHGIQPKALAYAA
jgi:hypothetical protein